MPNTSSMIIQIGNQITPDLGYDYYICGDGDYYGQSSASLSKDLTYSGYDNGACTFVTTAQSVTMSYSRDVFTYDTFDAGITQSINVCLIGSEHHCSQFSLPLNYPIMTVESALSIWGPRLQSLPLLVVAFLLLIL